MLKKFLKSKLFLAFALLSISINSFGNNFLLEDLEETEISLLTCDPGNEIYSLFGHSALRINNTKLKVDMVVNWGLFSFSEGQFQFGYDFAKGRLNYFMGYQNMENFIEEYVQSERNVREQILNLSSDEKKKILDLISENYLPKNREYRYEFFYDNCSSRIRDLIQKTLSNQINWGQSQDANEYTFRNIIHHYLKYDPWIELGIDLVLGKRIDVLVDNKNLMFLPDYLELILDESSIEDEEKKKKLISKKINIVQSSKTKREVKNISVYAWITLIITLLLLIIKKEKLFNLWSYINLFMVGILGLLLVFMWFGTDHQATKYNLNLLWASPLHLILLYFIFKNNWNTFSYWYIFIALVLLFTTVLFWFTLTQELNTFVKPIILELGLIYYYYLRKNKNIINLNSTKD